MSIKESDFTPGYHYDGYEHEIARGEVAVGYTINKYSYPDGTVRYDWRTDSGDESDEWYETFEDAEYDARQRLGE